MKIELQIELTDAQAQDFLNWWLGRLEDWEFYDPVDALHPAILTPLAAALIGRKSESHDAPENDDYETFHDVTT